MARFDSAIKLALRLITKNGRPCTLRHILPPDTEQDQPWRETGAAPQSDELNVPMVFLDYSVKFLETAFRSQGQEQGGSTILAGDKRALVAAASLASPPKLKDLIIHPGAVWAIQDIKVLQPNDQVILYDLQVRQ